MRENYKRINTRKITKELIEENCPYQKDKNSHIKIIFSVPSTWKNPIYVGEISDNQK